jgi:ABC-type dipeptide/oligopeptide/nickel transport system permease component
VSIGTFLIQRAIQIVVTLWGISLVVFLLLRLAPGDPVTVMLGDWATPEQVAQMRRDMGLDEPIYVQYGIYLRNLLQGNLGTGIRSQRPALELVVERVPATMQLSVSAFLIAVGIGLPIGIVSAIKRRTAYENVSIFVALLAQSIPGFWLGLMLIVVFSVQLGLLPVSGRGGLTHLVLPAITLSFYFIGLIIRVSRSEMLEVMNQDYIRSARAKGLSELVVVVRHGLRNGLIPIVTILGLQLGTLFGGAVITETVFAWPGMGTLTVNSIYSRDYPVVQASVLLFGTIFVLINTVVDLLYYYIDPRIKGA